MTNIAKKTFSELHELLKQLRKQRSTLANQIRIINIQVKEKIRGKENISKLLERLKQKRTMRSRLAHQIRLIKKEINNR